MQAIARTPLQLGNSIRQRRRELGLTQEQLAAKAGMRQRTISDIEKGGLLLSTSETGHLSLKNQSACGRSPRQDESLQPPMPALRSNELLDGVGKIGQ
jgi:transcriptional regulator with XRE-family HTH domain